MLAAANRRLVVTIRRPGIFTDLYDSGVGVISGIMFSARFAVA